MVPVILWSGVKLPRKADGALDLAVIGHVAIVGVLLQALYLGGVWKAIELGMPAGLSALIVGLQPLLTAVIASHTGEHITRRQWTGLLLGIAGVVLVVSAKLATIGLSLGSVSLCLVGLVAITGGTLYQKKHVSGVDLRLTSVVQFAAALIFTLPFAWWLETMQVRWTFAFFGALAWAVLALSIGAISLLLLLIRQGSATRVSSLMYLTPSVTAVLAWLLVGEKFTVMASLGLVVSAIGVALVVRRSV